MTIHDLDHWSELLLDVGKRNNLINFKDTASSTAEILKPHGAALFQRIDDGVLLEVYDPKLAAEETEEAASAPESPAETDGDERRRAYFAEHGPKVKKSNMVLLYNAACAPLSALKNIQKKTNMLLEETGVNVAYMAFGFLHWKEKDGDPRSYPAPLLLAPIRVERASALAPYCIRFTEDSVVVNPTLSFKLAAEYGLRLPSFEQDDPREYLASVATLTASLGWTVTDECKLGLFSFLKINMVEDLKANRERILKNRHARALLGLPPEETSAKEAVPTARKEPLELHNVVEADASQLEAVRLAKAGQSFVLQGPPGTGKSQTITNIIAECLGDGKKVLFVSEKPAALNVVYEKLRQAGLEEFCLELHSHKANKRSVIEELCRTLRLEKHRVSERADAELSERARAQARLDDYTEELHRVRAGVEKSLYELLEEHAAHRTIPDTEILLDEIGEWTEERLRSAEELLRDYGNFIPMLGADYRQCAWYGYIGTDSTYRARAALQRQLSEAAKGLTVLSELAQRLDDTLGLHCETLLAAQSWRQLLRLMADAETVTPALLDPSAFADTAAALLRLRALADKLLLLRKSLNERYREGLYELDTARLLPLLRRCDSLLPRLFNKDYKQLVKELRQLRPDHRKPSYGEVLETMETLDAYQTHMREFLAEEEKLRAVPGARYKGIDTDWPLFETELKELASLLESGIDTEPLAKLSQEEFSARTDTFRSFAEELDACLASCHNAVEALCPQFHPARIDLRNAPIDLSLAHCRGCLEDFGLLETWCQLRDLLERVKEQKLIPFLDDAIDRGIPAEQLSPLLRKSVCRQWIEHILGETPALARLSRIPHDRAVERFAEKDLLQFAINRAKLREEISAHRPSMELLTPGSAVSILLREGEKKRRQKSIRTLFAEAGSVIQLLKPCFLMSPLSVSTFLGADTTHFDLVVFDEASQIFPQDALGAIWRAEQVIVVGDSKQMPPSNFFTASIETAEESAEESVSDYESILDLCAATLPQLHLKWHYRSRFESLIAFSNRHFYNGELVTFPAAQRETEGMGVTYHHTNGFFEHGKRINRGEAEYVVDLIYRQIRAYPERSLGIVAFSATQQELIDRLLTARRREDPSLEEFFTRDGVEPFFIKNLETVQGDERDTIIFSIAYAKDQNGKLLQNFGPLNRPGGERRLNVAVTRAKCQVCVVASIHGSEIRVSPTSEGGVRLLKEYLDYAEQAATCETAQSRPSEEQADGRALENEIREFLERNGYRTEQRVGSSLYPVEIAVRAPDDQSYLLAIECDGPDYHRLGNARDRNRLRPMVLGRMGWHYHRVWSVDWFTNKPMEQELLLEAVRSAPAIPSAEEPSLPEGAEERYTEALPPEHFSFPSYEKAELEPLRRRYRDDLPSIVKGISETEAPLSEEWLLKRIAPLFGREKVTSVVVEEYERRMVNCERIGVLRRNGYLYRIGQDTFPFRTPVGAPREIKYIAPEELASGMLEILRRNISMEKDQLFRMTCGLLGFKRPGSASYQKLEEALLLLSERIDRNGTTLTVRQE